MGKGYCFVSGCARSGTSELVRLLNASPSILIGMERFFLLIERGELNHDHFSQDYFGHIQADDTHASGGLTVDAEAYEQRYENAKIVGDKHPNLYQHFDQIFETFPRAKHLYILRNPLSVVESYQVRFNDLKDSWRYDYRIGLDHWNESVARVASLSEDRLNFFHFVVYEKIFSDYKNYSQIMNFLQVQSISQDDHSPYSKRFAELSRNSAPRNDFIRQYVSVNADWNSYKKIIERASAAG